MSGDLPKVSETRHGRVLELVIHNPAQRNALLPEISMALTRALRLASDDAATGAIGRTKRLLDEARSQDLSRHLERERESFADALYGQEGGEGLAAFLEKRKPRFNA